MIRWIFLLLALSGGPVLAQGTGEQRAEAAGQSLIGSPAPRRVLKTIDGQAIDLAKLYGKKAVYLKFWATWCVPCREQMPHFEKTYEARGSDLEVIAVNAGFNDSVEDVREYRKRLGIKMPIVIDDGTLGTALNLRVTPQHVVIGRDGRIQYMGHLANEQLESALLAARKAPAGEKAEVASTTPVKLSVHGVGDTAPAFSVTALDGAKFTNKGPVVLVFLSPWCESYLEKSRAAVSARCRDVREQVESLAKQHPDVRWLGVASGLWSSQDELSQYAAAYKVTIPLTMDASSAMFNSFHVRSVPTIIAINGNGQIASRIEGNEPGLTAALARVALVR